MSTPAPTPTRFGQQSTLKAAKSKYGQLSDTNAAVLLHLHAHGSASRIDLEMLLKTGNLTRQLSSMVTYGYIAHVHDPLRNKHYKITNAGRVAIGMAAPDQPKPAPHMRICNASMLGTTLDLSLHTHMGRVGLARIGVAAR